MNRIIRQSNQCFDHLNHKNGSYISSNTQYDQNELSYNFQKYQIQNYNPDDQNNEVQLTSGDQMLQHLYIESKSPQQNRIKANSQSNRFTSCKNPLKFLVNEETHTIQQHGIPQYLLTEDDQNLQNCYQNINYYQQKQQECNSVYFGYKDYDYTDTYDNPVYSTTYYYCINADGDSSQDYYFEFVVQRELQKQYFFELFIRLLRKLSRRNKKSYNIYCNSTYYTSVLQIINGEFDEKKRQDNKYSQQIKDLIYKFSISGLIFSVHQTNEDVMHDEYLSHKTFPKNQQSSVPVQNEYSNKYIREFLNSETLYNSEYSEQFSEISEKYDNEQISEEIIPYYHTSSRENDKSSSRSYSRSRSRSRSTSGKCQNNSSIKQKSNQRKYNYNKK